jgi:hypothetical protein
MKAALGALAPAVAHTVEWPPMAPKQRQVRLEQRGGIEAIQALEQRSDEELEAETKYKAAALAILASTRMRHAASSSGPSPPHGRRSGCRSDVWLTLRLPWLNAARGT